MSAPVPAESLPKPLELIVRGEGDEAVAYICPECRLAFFLPDSDEAPAETERRAAEHCFQACACGARSPSVPCEACRTRALLELRRQQFARARKVAANRYDGPIYCPDLGEDTDPEAYFMSVSALRAHYTAIGASPPPHAWTCTLFAFRIDARDVLRRALDEHHDGAANVISGAATRELQDLLDTWCARQPKIVTYEPDYTRAVVIVTSNRRIRTGAKEEVLAA